jgi:hypothetical protein
MDASRDTEKPSLYVLSMNCLVQLHLYNIKTVKWDFAIHTQVQYSMYVMQCASLCIYV